MLDRPPELLDKDIRRAADLLRAGRAALFPSAPEDAAESATAAAPTLATRATLNPLRAERGVSTRSMYLELGERAGDPLATAMRAWVYVLTLERVLWPDTVNLAAAWQEASVEMHEPVASRMSPRALLERVLAEPLEARRRAWAEALGRGGPRISDAAHVLAERRAEAIRLLGESDPDALEIPCDPPGAVAALADQLLERTSPMTARDVESWDDALARSIARGATSGWPAKLNARWIFEQVRSTRLTEGLAIELGRLPTPLGASSFVRAFAELGRAFAEAAVPASAPFVLARPPFDVRVARRAALFGSLLTDPTFGVRVLGLGRDRAREQAREIAQAALITLRLDAARVRLRGVLLSPSKLRAARVEEETARALGAPIPGSLAGVVPKLGPGDALTLAGTLLAATDRRELIERFDEDWFRNPHAAQALREEQAMIPASPRASTEALERGLNDLIRSLEELLG